MQLLTTYLKANKNVLIYALTLISVLKNLMFVPVKNVK